MMFGSIGVIGQGFVGTAVREGLRHAFEVVTYDVKESDRLRMHDAVVNSLSFVEEGSGIQRLIDVVDGPVFVCLPTPMKADGSCDISTVEEVMAELNAAAKELDRYPVIVLKSTVPPGTTEKLYGTYEHLGICFNPEFLREVSPNEDFKKQDRIILGGYGVALEKARFVFATAFPGVPIYEVDSEVAEMVKYATNVFLATKVSLANEFYQVCKVLGIDYDRVWKLVALDKRLTESHWQVPGPDLRVGFGGSCFPKDLNGLIRVALDCGVDPKVMRAAWEKNLEVRPERDWERLVGRAVVEKEKSH